MSNCIEITFVDDSGEKVHSCTVVVPAPASAGETCRRIVLRASTDDDGTMAAHGGVEKIVARLLPDHGDTVIGGVRKAAGHADAAAGGVMKLLLCDAVGQLVSAAAGSPVGSTVADAFATLAGAAREAFDVTLSVVDVTDVEPTTDPALVDAATAIADSVGRLQQAATSFDLAVALLTREAATAAQ